VSATKRFLPAVCCEAALAEAGLVDEIGFSIHPVLVGGGVPAFLPFSHRVELELVEGRSMANGCVLVRYRVFNQG